MTDGAPRGAFQVGPGMRVRLEYEVFDEDGERVEDGAQEMAYFHGYGALLPRLERALEGHRAGDACGVSLPPEEAFGRRRQEAILEVARDDFPDDVAPGDRFEAESDDGRMVILRVLEIQPDGLVLDTNHPLAGQRVRFELRVLEVRPGTEAELAQAEAKLTEPSADSGLLPVERLLQGPSRRYEMGRSGPRKPPTDPADET